MDGPITNNRESWSLNNPDYTGWNFTTGRMERVMMAWQVSTLSFVPLQVDSSGNLMVTGGSSGTTDEAMRMDVYSSALSYVGYATPGSATSSAVWKIKLLTYSGSNLVSVTWAGGTASYNQIWDNHLALSYS